MDRLYPVFHFELPMLASSDGRVKREWSCQREAGGPQVVPRWREGNNSKALIGQTEKALQGLGGIGLKCPLARNLL